MPTATDLVTDLPADFEVFGQAVDTRLKALQPGTTLGDLAYSSATANTNTRLALGTAGQVLTVNSGATAPEWKAAGGTANWSLVNAGGTALTGAQTITVSGISGANQIFVLCSYVGSASASSLFSFRFNADSGSNYIMSGVLEGTASNDLLHTGSTTGIQFATMGNNTGNTVTPAMLVSGSSTSGVKIFDCVAMGNGTGAVGRSIKGVYSGSSAITSVSIISSIGNFDEGTIWVYTTA
jgi:hypothetical protein